MGGGGVSRCMYVSVSLCVFVVFVCITICTVVVEVFCILPACPSNAL